MHGRPILAALALATALLCSGCIHHIGGAKLPTRGWTAQPVDCAVLKAKLPTRATLRIFACHAFWYGDHAALSVSSPSGLFGFWDPAGWLTSDMKWKDKDDVICRPFDLQFYWRWRSEDYDGLDMLVFEWDISEQEAQRIHRLLTCGCYTTSTLPGLCCANVVNFVQGQIKNICVPPPPFSLSPGVLGEWLWSQDPDRVLVFHKCARTRVFRPVSKLDPVTNRMRPITPRSERVTAPDPEPAPATLGMRLPAPGTRLPAPGTRLPAPGTVLRYSDIAQGAR